MNAVCVFSYICISLHSVEGRVRGCQPTLVCMNKLQAWVRYTHITCRYRRINRPELLIARDVLTAPVAGKLLASWAKTLHISLSSLTASFQPNLPPEPMRNCHPHRIHIEAPPWLCCWYIPSGVNQMDNEGTCTNIAHLTYMKNLWRAPSRTNSRTPAWSKALN